MFLSDKGVPDGVKQNKFCLWSSVSVSSSAATFITIVTILITIDKIVDEKYALSIFSYHGLTTE